MINPPPASLSARAQLAWEKTIKQCPCLLEQPRLLQSLHAVFVYSDYVAWVCQHYPEIIHDLVLSQDIENPYTLHGYSERLASLLSAVKSEDDLTCQLRRFRHREMLRIVWRDFSELATLEQTMHDLSMLADACIGQSLSLLHAWQQKVLGQAMDSKHCPQSLYVIAVGKLGGKELNFSSDIDLIFAFPEHGYTDKSAASMSNEEYFTKLAQRLIKLLSEVTRDGFVFRVDMRVRPYGSAGPLAMSFSALETYYQEQGREWERYALLRARVMGKEKQACQQLQSMLNAFVYRRYVDFNALSALRHMKKLMDKEAKLQKRTHDIKRGQGGIRECEFAVQALQLIFAGQKKYLRTASVLWVMKLFADYQLMPPEMVGELRRSYAYLRRVEHVIQMQHDKQTHSLPDNKLDQQRLFCVLGYKSWQAFITELDEVRTRVHRHFQAILTRPELEGGSSQEQAISELASIWCQQSSNTMASACLQRYGYDDPMVVLALFEKVQKNRRFRRTTEMVRLRLRQLIPLLLIATAQSTNPLVTLSRLLDFVVAVLGRSAYLVLLLENPAVVDTLVELFSHSAWVARQVCEYPFLLGELLTPIPKKPYLQSWWVKKCKQECQATQALDSEQTMEILRRVKLQQRWHLACAELLGHTPAQEVNVGLTRLATGLLAQTQAWLRKRDDNQSNAFAIVAYGKCGAYEMHYVSDLDIIFLYDSDTVDEQVVLPMARRLLQLFAVRTSLGRLYAVDTRLRPSGSAGLLVTSFASYEDYQLNKAWTWEHQALVKARMVLGPPKLCQQFKQLRNRVLCRQRDVSLLQKDIVAMRQRLRENFSGAEATSVTKHGEGGLVDIEFIIQYAVLAWAHAFPALTRTGNSLLLLKLLARNQVLTASQAQCLIRAYGVYQKHLHQALLKPDTPWVSPEELTQAQSEVMQVRQVLGLAA